MKTHKILKTISILLAALFILAQFTFKMTSSGGAWCSPYLGAPVELGHPAYQFADYGFPLPFITAVKADCFSAQSTTYEWSPIGMGVDSLLLVLLAYPIWSGFLRKKSMNKNGPTHAKLLT